MLRNYFKIRYEFDPEEVHLAISKRLDAPGSDYICVADGVILNIANSDHDYLEVVNGGMFSICDSSYVPLYVKLIHGEQVSQYCGSQIFRDIVAQRRYRMIFLGTQQPILNGLKQELSAMNPDVENMQFIELPFLPVEKFDYEEIARTIEHDQSQIVWVALGAPKQEQFMALLKPHLHGGVMIAVGAAFKFYSGLEVNRAPKWMVDHHLEFIHRIYKEPRKQLRRCGNIVATLPGILIGEWRRKRNSSHR